MERPFHQHAIEEHADVIEARAAHREIGVEIQVGRYAGQIVHRAQGIVRQHRGQIPDLRAVE